MATILWFSIFFLVASSVIAFIARGGWPSAEKRPRDEPAPRTRARTKSDPAHSQPATSPHAAV